MQKNSTEYTCKHGIEFSSARSFLCAQSVHKEPRLSAHEHLIEFCLFLCLNGQIFTKLCCDTCLGEYHQKTVSYVYLVIYLFI